MAVVHLRLRPLLPAALPRPQIPTVARAPLPRLHLLPLQLGTRPLHQTLRAPPHPPPPLPPPLDTPLRRPLVHPHLPFWLPHPLLVHLPLQLLTQAPQLPRRHSHPSQRLLTRPLAVLALTAQAAAPAAHHHTEAHLPRRPVAHPTAQDLPLAAPAAPAAHLAPHNRVAQVAQVVRTVQDRLPQPLVPQPVALQQAALVARLALPQQLGPVAQVALTALALHLHPADLQPVVQVVHQALQPVAQAVRRVLLQVVQAAPVVPTVPDLLHHPAAHPHLAVLLQLAVLVAHQALPKLVALVARMAQDPPLLHQAAHQQAALRPTVQVHQAHTHLDPPQLSLRFPRLLTALPQPLHPRP